MTNRELEGLYLNNSLNISQLADNLTEKTSYGVISGLGVTAQSTPDMTVKVATGVIYMANGDRFEPTANDALAVTAADATNPRRDIVFVSSAGVISYLAGTAAAVDEKGLLPAAPAIPTGGQLLAEIYVGNGVTTVVTANIQDRRKNLYSEAWIYPTLLNGWVEYTSAMILKYCKNSDGVVHVVGKIKSGASMQAIFTLPVGYRPSFETNFSAVTNNTTNIVNIIVSPTGAVFVSFTSMSTWISMNFSFKAEQ